MWQGKHAQAPVAVAAKPHYFSELDVNKTMRNILKHRPEFFASEQFLSSVGDGTITALDRAYFCQVWLHPVSFMCCSTLLKRPGLKHLHYICAGQHLQHIMLGACNACKQTVKAKPQCAACRSCASCSLMVMQTSELPSKAVWSNSPSS